MRGAGVLLAAALLAAGHASGALEIHQVRHEPAGFDPGAGGSVGIRFRLSEAARVAVDVYDGRDLRIRRIESESVLSAGEHSVVWDGRDFAGRPVPPEAYVYTIEAEAPSGEPVLWDATDTSGRRTLPSPEADWDADAGVVRYELPESARVQIRIGLANNGPLLRTLIDWVPRAAGAQADAWDGRDGSGVLEVASHPSLAIQVRAFSLPRNAVLVTPAPSAVAFVPGLPADAPRRQRTAAPPKRMFDYPHQAIESRRDFPLEIELPPDLPRNGEGLPIVSGPIGVRISVSDEDLARILNERCEAVFYVDGRFVFENEVAFLPMTWTWNPERANPGTHTITANLRGYEGHLGTASVKVFVEEGSVTR